MYSSSQFEGLKELIHSLFRVPLLLTLMGETVDPESIVL